mgnify:CR=1 FL=1
MYSLENQRIEVSSLQSESISYVIVRDNYFSFFSPLLFPWELFFSVISNGFGYSRLHVSQYTFLFHKQLKNNVIKQCNEFFICTEQKRLVNSQAKSLDKLQFSTFFTCILFLMAIFLDSKLLIFREINPAPSLQRTKAHKIRL